LRKTGDVILAKMVFAVGKDISEGSRVGKLPASLDAAKACILGASNADDATAPAKIVPVLRICLRVILPTMNCLTFHLLPDEVSAFIIIQVMPKR